MKVAIYYNAKYVCSAPAEKELKGRPDCFGFNVMLPEVYRDGKARKYWVKSEPWGIILDGSPQILKFD